MSTTTVTSADTAHLDYVLRIADSALVLGQRLSEWCGHGPVIEEDIALTNTALDLIGQARLLLAHAGSLEGRGRDEDALAFLRAEPQYRNLTICELPNDDFGRTILRNFLFAAWQMQLWPALAASSDAQLAAIAGKSVKESRYHLQHASDWTVRLGDGTDESHARMQRALDYLWPYTAEFFSPTATDEAAAAAGIGPAWSTLAEGWEAAVLPVLEVATLKVPARTAFLSHGKQGRHSEHMGHLLAEMQYLQRAYPGATW
jgi:ring-1,2-phenylacetyl-CoA epoxidase subunit PaaC